MKQIIVFGLLGFVFLGWSSKFVAHPILVLIPVVGLGVIFLTISIGIIKQQSKIKVFHNE